MGKRLVFDGLPPEHHTWFETRREPQKVAFKRGPIVSEMVEQYGLRTNEHVKLEQGGFVAQQDFEITEYVGGDHVQAHPGSSFPLDYVDEKFIEQHTRTKLARVVDVPDQTPTPTPTPAAAPASQPEAEDETDTPPRGRGRIGG